MQDLTDVKIFLAELFRPVLQPIVYEAVRAAQTAALPPVAIEQDELLTPEETAGLLKVSKVTVWDWEKRGILKKHHIGNQVRYLRSEVLAAVLKKTAAGA